MYFITRIVKNALRRPRTHAALTASVAAALFLFALLQSLPGVVDQFLGAAASPMRLVVHHHAGTSYLMPEAHAARIAAVPGVTGIAVESWFGGVYADAKDDFPNTAISPEQVERVWPDWDIAPAALAAFKENENAALVGRELLARHGWSVGDEITLRGRNYPVDLDLQIVGTLGDKAVPTYLVLRRDFLADRAAGVPPPHGASAGEVDAFWIRVARAEDGPAVIAAIDALFAGQVDATRTVTEAEYVAGFFDNLDPLFRMAGQLAALIVPTAALVAAALIALSLRRRMDEIRLLRALGSSPGEIRAALIGETTLAAVTGGALGCLVCYALLRITTGSTEFQQFGVIQMPAEVVVQTLGLALLIGVIGSSLAARTAVRRADAPSVFTRCES